MHILYLMPAEGFGATERQGVVHIEWLRALGHKVTAVVGLSAPLLHRLDNGERNKDTIWLDEFPPKHAATTSWKAHLDFVRSWSSSICRNAKEIQRIASVANFDIIFANRTCAWPIAALVGRRIRVPYAVFAGSRPRIRCLPRLLCFTRLLGSEPVLLVSNCKSVEESFEPYIRCPKLILPNAVDLDEYYPRNRKESCRQLGLDPSRPRVALAIRPSVEKGMVLLCRTALLLREARSNIEIDIAGDYRQRECCERFVRDTGLGDTVLFLGHTDQIGELYGASDLVLLPSRSDSVEGSRNALLEAMACGKAIVASEVGGIAELIEHGREGLLVPDGDPNAMASAILDVLWDQCARQGMGHAGQRKAKREHSAPIVVEQLAIALERQMPVKGLGGV